MTGSDPGARSGRKSPKVPISFLMFFHLYSLTHIQWRARPRHSRLPMHVSHSADRLLRRLAVPAGDAEAAPDASFGWIEACRPSHALFGAGVCCKRRPYDEAAGTARRHPREGITERSNLS